MPNRDVCYVCTGPEEHRYPSGGCAAMTAECWPRPIGREAMRALLCPRLTLGVICMVSLLKQDDVPSVTL